MICLDAWAVIALLRDEPGSAEISAAIHKGQAVMSWINLGEVVYVVSRRSTPADAHELALDLASQIVVELPDAALVLAAADIKAAHRMSYADSFAVATALRHDADLLTSDPDILSAAGALGLRARPPRV